jgi:hypothetical protein
MKKGTTYVGENTQTVEMHKIVPCQGLSIIAKSAVGGDVTTVPITMVKYDSKINTDRDYKFLNVGKLPRNMHIYSRPTRSEKYIT